MSAKKWVPLSALTPGAAGYVMSLEGGRGFTHRVSSMGLSVGSRFEVMHQGGAAGESGSVVIRVGETRLMIGHGMAEKIMVRVR